MKLSRHERSRRKKALKARLLRARRRKYTYAYFLLQIKRQQSRWFFLDLSRMMIQESSLFRRVNYFKDKTLEELASRANRSTTTLKDTWWLYCEYLKYEIGKLDVRYALELLTLHKSTYPKMLRFDIPHKEEIVS